MKKKREVDRLLQTMEDILQNDPKLALARIRFLLAVKSFKDSGTSSQLSDTLGVDNKYFRKYAAEAEKAGYITRVHLDLKEGDRTLYKNTQQANALLYGLFGLI